MSDHLKFAFISQCALPYIARSPGCALASAACECGVESVKFAVSIQLSDAYPIGEQANRVLLQRVQLTVCVSCLCLWLFWLKLFNCHFDSVEQLNT